MPIEVKCTEGHRLSCPDEWAGKQGRCPKCGKSFHVPAAEENGDTIVFLCPNGHKLNGPSSLQGSPGQCPECGTKFRIPDYDEDAEVEEVEEGETVEQVEVVIDETEPAPEMLDDIEILEAADDPEEVEEIEIEELPTAAVPPPPVSSAPLFEDDDLLPDPSLRPHPMARLFATLWQERDHGGVVEVHLEGGVTLLPDWWARRLLHETHAVFALQTSDGTYVMETVPWDAVRRISVRQIKELPGGLFE